MTYKILLLAFSLLAPAGSAMAQDAPKKDAPKCEDACRQQINVEVAQYIDALAAQMYGCVRGKLDITMFAELSVRVNRIFVLKNGKLKFRPIKNSVRTPREGGGEGEAGYENIADYSESIIVYYQATEGREEDFPEHLGGDNFRIDSKIQKCVKQVIGNSIKTNKPNFMPKGSVLSEEFMVDEALIQIVLAASEPQE